MRREPVPTAELLTWIEDDWLGLWELTSMGGTEEGVPPTSVIDFVVQSVEPGLRAGLIRLGRVYETGQFEPLDLSIDKALALIREGVWRDRADILVDLWFDTVPPGGRSSGRASM